MPEKREKSLYRKPNGAGKGDQPRPLSIPQKKWEERWEKIFRGSKKDVGNI